MAPAAYGGDLLPDVRGNVAGRSASCTAVATGDRAFKLAQLELLNGNNNNHVGLPSMPLDTPGPGSWKPSSMLHLVEEGDGEDYDDGKGGKKKGVMKSVSSFFKNLVKSNSKPDSDSVLTVGSSGGSVRDVTHVSPALSPQASAHSGSAMSPHLLASTASDDNGGRRQSGSRPGTGPGGAGGKKGDGATTPQGSRLSFTSMFNRKSSKALSALANAPPSPKCKLLARSPVAPPKMNRPEWRMKDYAIVEKVYTGYASTVYKAFCKLSGVMVCLKAYNLANLCELNRYQIFREIRLHSSLQHEHIITLYGAFQEGSEVVLVQEYADGGDLFNLLHKYGGRMSERTCVELVLWPFLNVLLFLHAEHIVHRDIKPENVLFTSDKRLKLCDFGLAIDLREERAVTRAGTLEYMAPEVLNCPFKSRPDENKEKESIHYSNAVDAWAMGVLTYELLVGMPPFHDKQRNAIEDKIRISEPRFPSKMSDAARNFITEALAKDAIERPTIRDMMSHPLVHMHRSNRSMRNLAAPRKPVPTADEEETDLRNELQQMATPKYQSFTAGKLHKPAVMMVPKRAGLEAGTQSPGSVLPSIVADPGVSPKAQNQARFKQWAGAMPLPPTSGLVEVGRTHSVL